MLKTGKRDYSRKQAGAWLLTCAALCASQIGSAQAEQSTAQLLREAERLMAEGRPTDAMDASRKVLQMEPKNEEAHNQLGLCLVHLHQFDQAADEFRTALECNAQYLPALHNLGSMFYRNGDYDLAISYFNKEMKTETTLWHRANLNTLLSLADAYRDRASTRKDSAEAAPDYDQALAFYMQADGRDPESAPLHNHLGVYYFQRGELQKAQQETQRAIELKKDYAAAYYNLALIEEKQNKTQSALDALRNSLKYEREPEYRKQVRDRLAKMGSPSAGEPQLVDLSGTPDERGQTSPSTLPMSERAAASDVQAKSQALLAQGKWSEAESMLRGAIKGSPRHDEVVWNNLGYALAMQDKTREAVECYQKAIQLMPEGFASAHYNLGQALFKLGEIGGAEKSFKRAIEQSGGMNALAHNALGLVYKHNKQLQSACAEYKLAILQSGDTLPVVHFNLALALEEQNNGEMTKQAIVQYRRYLQQSPRGLNAPAARLRLATLDHE